MKRLLIILLCLLCHVISFTQSEYIEYIQQERDSINTEFLQTTDSILKQLLIENGGLSFYPISEDYIVKAKFNSVDSPEVYITPTRIDFISFSMTSFAMLTFNLNNEEHQLTIFTDTKMINTNTGEPIEVDSVEDPDSEEEIAYSISFLDETSGMETYGGGRFMDIYLSDITDGEIILDFNRSYNPACAYYSESICMSPPLINTLKTKVEAGVKSMMY